MNPPDFTVNSINVIDAPDATQIRDQNGQIQNVNRQTAYNRLVANPLIQKLSYDSNNIRINLIPVLGSDLNQYVENGLMLDGYIIIPNDYYVIVVNISANPLTIIGLYHLPVAPVVPIAPPVAPVVPVAAPPDVDVLDNPEYRVELANRIT